MSQFRLLGWFDAMFACYEHQLSDAERQSLAAYERSPEFQGTSNWPGWERYIGKRPQPHHLALVEDILRRKRA